MEVKCSRNNYIVKTYIVEKPVIRELVELKMPHPAVHNKGACSGVDCQTGWNWFWLGLVETGVVQALDSVQDFGCDQKDCYKHTKGRRILEQIEQNSYSTG